MSVRHTGVTTLASPCGSADRDCDIRELLDRIGDRWSVLVVMNLASGVLRFRELQRTVPGISQRMLTLTLRRLERDGLLARTVYATVPPQVEYELTELGHGLRVQLQDLAHWAAEHRDVVMAAQSRFDAERGASRVPQPLSCDTAQST